MAIDWTDVALKAHDMKAKLIKVIEVSEDIRDGVTKSGRGLSATTLLDLKNVDGVAARSDAQSAWSILNAAMTP